MTMLTGDEFRVHAIGFLSDVSEDPSGETAGRPRARSTATTARTGAIHGHQPGSNLKKFFYFCIAVFSNNFTEKNRLIKNLNNNVRIPLELIVEYKADSAYPLASVASIFAEEEREYFFGTDQFTRTKGVW